MTKVALCLCGLVGGAEGKDGRGTTLDSGVPYEHYKRYILNLNDVDIFVHSWSERHRDQLQALYQPTYSVFQTQIQFSDDFRKHITYSRWYSQKQSIGLKRQYEEENNFKYDFVMVSRLDLLWFTDVVFEDYDPKFFYASHWNHNGPKKIGPYDRRNLNKGKGFLDFWFFSNSANMDRFGQLYDHLDELLPSTSLSSHSLSRAWVDRLKLPIKFVFWRGFDHEIYRRWRRPGWHAK